MVPFEWGVIKAVTPIPAWASACTDCIEIDCRALVEGAWTVMAHTIVDKTQFGQLSRHLHIQYGLMVNM